MNTLKKLQTDFSNAVLNDQTATLSFSIVANNLDPVKRIQVYQNNINSSLTEALLSVYPVVAQLVGEEYFKYCAELYVSSYPSQSGNLHEFGERFSELLGSLESAQDLVYLSDVATLEWAYHLVFHAKNATPLDITSLQSVSIDDYHKMHFKLNPANQLISSEYPILKIWQSNQCYPCDGEPISLDEGGIQLLVARNKFDIEFHALTTAECAFLNACQRNASYISACDAAVELEAEFDIQESLLKFIRQNIITDFIFA